MRMSPFVRRNKGIFFVIAFSAGLLLVIVGLFRIDSSTNRMIVEYIENLGWDIEDSPEEITHMTFPNEFDAVYRAYNDVQKASGFDFEQFRGKKVTRYSYRVLNHKMSDEVCVIASVYVCDGTVIGGDVASSDGEGFLHSIADVSYIRE